MIDIHKKKRFFIQLNNKHILEIETFLTISQCIKTNIVFI